MRPHLLLIAALAACFDEGSQPETAPGDGQPAELPKKAKAPAAPPWEARLGQAQAKNFGADGAAALEAALKLLTDKPKEDALWILAESAALSHGDPKAALAALPAEAPGGQTGRFALLKAELSLAAEDAPGALGLAQQAQADAPDAAAAMLARAVAAGASLPEDGDDAPTPGEALAKWAQAANERAAKPYAEAALAVAGWQAAALRGEVFARRGSTAEAIEAYGAAAEDADPRAKVAGNLGRAAVVLSSPPAAEGPTVADAAGWAAEAVGVALDAGMAGEAMRAAEDAAAANLRAVQADEAVAAIEPLFARLQESEGGETLARAGVLLARTALAAGKPTVAADAAKAAREAVGEDGDAALREAAAWQEAWAAWSLGRAEQGEAAAGVLDGPRKAVAEGLALASQGQLDSAAAKLNTGGLDPRDAAYTAMAAARIDPGSAVSHLQAAVRSADASRDRSLAVTARLALEEAGRAARSTVAARTRAELARMAPDGAAGAGLRLELAARALAGGAKAELDTDAPAHWTALANGAATTDKGDAVSQAAAAWAAARAMALTGMEEPADLYNRALGLLPVHRQGALDSGTALDGSEGFDFERDLAALAQTGDDPGSVAAALAVQESNHRLVVARTDLDSGRDIAAELPEAEREALLAAAARVRASMVRYHAGAGDLPVADFEALAAAEAKAAEAQKSFVRVLPTDGPSVADLRRACDGAALLSYSVGPSSVYGVALTSQGGILRKLGDAKGIVSLAGKHRAALEGAVGKGAKAPHAAGDGLRRTLLDPFMSDLSGYGRYLVMAQPDVFTFPFTTFPEQADGLRWLAAIRTVGAAPDLRSIAIPDEGEGEEERPTSYNPDYLGFGGIKKAAAVADDAPDNGGTSDQDLLRRHRAKSDMPLDLAAASRHFGDDFRKILVGESATKEGWAENATKARYIHISEVAAAEDGGFEFSDGQLSLSSIRTTPLRAELVVITSAADPDEQMARARAFLDAGAESVVVTAWELPAPVLDRLFDGFYEALNRDRPPATAAREARESLLRTALDEQEQDDPADWGALMMYSLP